MKKEKADLEQLLNSLIEKGWKPFGKRNKLYAVEDGIYILGRIASDWNTYDLRQIVSKESGLWQFVCENGMIMKDQYTNTTRIQEYEDERDSETYRTKYDEGSYLFRLIESSLKDESELEDFLLSNIKVDG